MKSFFFVLTLSLSLYAVKAFANSSQIAINKIASGRLYDLKSVSQEYYKKDEPEILVLDALAETLWTKYRYMPAAESDTYAWICNALAKEQSGRYIPLLEEVLAMTGNAKLSKYADKALDKQKSKRKKLLRKNASFVIETYQKGTVNLAAITAESRRNSVVMKSGLTMKQQDTFHLLNSDIEQFRRTVQKFYNYQENDTELLDVLAEILFSKYPTATDYDSDALAWGCKALGASKNERYAALLKEIIDSDVHSKLVKHAKASLRKLSYGDGYSYRKGMINLTRTLNEVAIVPHSKEKAVELNFNSFDF